MQIIFENDAELELGAADLGKSTLLELALKNDIKHTHACGGHARCSTCRVIVLDNPDNLSPRNEEEQKLAEKKGFPDEIRLACQTRVLGPSKVRRLVLDEEDADLAQTYSISTSGIEKKVAILFSDIRGFTRLTEGFLAYDIVHVLNRYFHKMGDAILHHRGHIDKYIGDGIMALFGIHSNDPREACLSAVKAGMEMQKGLDELNAYLIKHFKIKLKIGIGIHFGEVILGSVGHPQVMQYTAIGDAVNVASRVESATKEVDCPFLVSENLWKMVDDQVDICGCYEVALKGKTGIHKLYNISGLKEKPEIASPKSDIFSFTRDHLKSRINQKNAPLFLSLAFHKLVLNGAAEGASKNNLLNSEDGYALALRSLLDCQMYLKSHAHPIPMEELITQAGSYSVELCGGPRIDLSLHGGEENKEIEYFFSNTLLSQNRLSGFMKERGWSLNDRVALYGAFASIRPFAKAHNREAFHFDNSYFKALIRLLKNGDMGLSVHTFSLLSDEESRDYVQQYAANERLFFRHFQEAFEKHFS